MYRQYVLEFEDHVTVGWIETDAPLQPGTRLTLKGDDRIWTIVWSGATKREDPPDKRWKVGGLK